MHYRGAAVASTAADGGDLPDLCYESVPLLPQRQAVEDTELVLRARASRSPSSGPLTTSMC